MRLRPVVHRVAATRLLVVIVIVAVAAVVYEQTIPETSVIRARLAHLVVEPLGIPGYTEAASTAQQVPSASNPFAAVVAAAKVNPNHTGGYFREWKSPASKYKVAEVLAAYLPTTAESATTLKQAETALLSRTAYTADGYTYKGALVAPTIASGGYYEAKATKTTPASTLAVSALREGHVVVVIDTVGTDTTGTKADNVTLARLQQAHLKTVEPTFTMVKTSRPVLATALFAVATVAVAIAGVFMVTLVAGLRRRRRSRRAARARYELQVGGQRIVKHRRPTPR